MGLWQWRWTDRVADLLHTVAIAFGVALIRLGEWECGAALIVVAAMCMYIDNIEREAEVRRGVRRMVEEMERVAEERGKVDS